MAQHARLKIDTVCKSTSAIRTAHGSAAPTRTPTGCCASTSPKALISACTAPRDCRRSGRPQLPPRKTLDWKTPAEALDHLLLSVEKDALRPPFNPPYTSEQFQKLMAGHGVICSMSRSGNVWDNAAMESFFSSLKTERTARKTYRMRDEAKADVFDYIERFYNAKRRHSTIGYKSPMQFEMQAGLA